MVAEVVQRLGRINVLVTTPAGQPGDPAKAAAILAALEAENPPLRLPLGNDAADAISAQLTTAREQFTAWEKVTRGTDLDG